MATFKKTRNTFKMTNVRTSTESEGIESSADQFKLNESYCDICAQETSFVSIGKCNHPICTICTLRLRYKGGDRTCPICKQDLEYVVCYSNEHNRNAVFADFSISSIDTPLPGCDIDIPSTMVYSNCRDHYNRMIALRSIICPFTTCQLQFPTNEAIQKHLKDKHQHTFCQLCLDHRPLFLSEHTLYKPSKLKTHMNSPPAGISNGLALKSEGVGGHPICRFCNEHFYDTNELYQHMRSRHMTCHLCPSHHQHRFYRDAASLLDHNRESHIICSHCTIDEILNDGVEYAFRTISDLNQHLMQVHRVTGSNTNNLSQYLGFHVGGGGNNRESETRYLDMDWSSSDPNHMWRVIGNNPSRLNTTDNNELEGEEHDRGNLYEGRQNHSLSYFRVPHQEAPSTNSDAISLIPPNMRIAGRVTGSGQFQYTAEDRQLQRAAEEAAVRQAHITARVGKTNIKSDDENFPKLTEAAGTISRTAQMPTQNRREVSQSNVQCDAKLSVTGCKGNQHGTAELNSKLSSRTRNSGILNAIVSSVVESAPKCIVTKHGGDVAGKVDNDDNIDDKMRRLAARNLKLAIAFGVNTKNLEVVVDSKGRILEDFVEYLEALSILSSELLHPSSSQQLIEYLQKPFYPPLLLGFSKNYRSDLLKIEKKVSDLLATPSQNSVQLKPMSGAVRYCVHVLARYYRINSFEFDFEPKRYISLVKTAESTIPKITLSTATATPNLSPLQPLTAKLPILYLYVKDAISQYCPVGRPSSSFPPLHFVTADAIEYLALALRNEGSSYSRLCCKILDVKSLGPGGVSLALPDLCAALHCFNLLHSWSVFAMQPPEVGVDTMKSKKTTLSVPFSELFNVYAAFDVNDVTLAANLADAVKSHSNEENRKTQTKSGSFDDDSKPQEGISHEQWRSSLGKTSHVKCPEMKGDLKLQPGKPVIDSLPQSFVSSIQNEWDELPEEPVKSMQERTDPTFLVSTADLNSPQTVVKIQKSENTDECNMNQPTDVFSESAYATDVEKDPINQLELERSRQNWRQSQTDPIEHKLKSFTGNTGTYRKLVLQPRSNDLPPPLPPTQGEVNRKFQELSKKIKSTKNYDQNVKRKGVKTKPVYSFSQLVGDIETGENEGEADSFADPGDERPFAEPCGSIPEQQLGSNEQSFQLYTWSCRVCTLENVVYDSTVARTLHCEACTTFWCPP